jgi:hypothetical protein
VLNHLFKMSEKAPVDVTKLPRLYFNMYIAGVIRNRKDFEAINCDLLYFTLLMKMNQYAKEVYFLRKAKQTEENVKAVYDHLMILRKFVIDFYEIATPRWELIQNELTDPLSSLDELKLEEDPFGDRTTLGAYAEKAAPPKPASDSYDDEPQSPRKKGHVSPPPQSLDELSSSLDDLNLEPTTLSRQASVLPTDHP